MKERRDLEGPERDEAMAQLRRLVAAHAPLAVVRAVMAAGDDMTVQDIAHRRYWAGGWPGWVLALDREWGRLYFRMTPTAPVFYVDLVVVTEVPAELLAELEAAEE